ncbi:MAG TPA: NAD-dependent epimerase/dehydratase family protein [Hanamia sp.]
MLQENSRSEKNSSNKILVTGGSGLVGKELIRQLLDEGESVRATYHSTPISISHPNLELTQCDILDVIALEDCMRGIKHVYHSAASVSFDPKDKMKILKMNIEGTTNIVNACIDASVEKLVHVSSGAALGRIREGETVTEEMNWSEETNNSNYGESKYLSELEVWRGIGEGLQAVIVNPTLILGGDNWDSSSSAIFKKAYEEFEWYTDGVTGVVDVGDVARAMTLLMNSEISGQRFILNGENLPYREIFTRIAECFNKRPPYKKVTPLIAEVIWRAEALRAKFTGKKPLLTKETVRTAQAKVYFDNGKILNALPRFQFTKISDTIEHTCSKLKEKYSL